MTTAPVAAHAFYGKVMGWSTRDVSMSAMSYHLFTVNDVPAAGVMAQMEDARQAGIPPCWLGYVGVDDVDVSVAR